MKLSHVTKICTRRRFLEQNVYTCTFQTPGRAAPAGRAWTPASASPSSCGSTGLAQHSPPPQGGRCGGQWEGGSCISPIAGLAVTGIYCGKVKKNREECSPNIGLHCHGPTLLSRSEGGAGDLATQPGSCPGSFGAMFLAGCHSSGRSPGLERHFHCNHCFHRVPALRWHRVDALGALCPGHRPGPL